MNRGLCRDHLGSAMSNPWRWRRFQGFTCCVFHPGGVSLSRLHLLRHFRRMLSTSKVVPLAFLYAATSLPYVIKSTAHGSNATQADPSQIGIPGTLSCSLFGQHSAVLPGFITQRAPGPRNCAFEQATMEMIYNFLSICQMLRPNLNNSVSKSTPFADTKPCPFP